jgi:Tol biopolymer transport system component
VNARRGAFVLVVAGIVAACGVGPSPPARSVSAAPSPDVVSAPPSAAPSTPRRTEGDSENAVLVGTPVDLSTLTGKIVFDDFEDVFTMNADGSDLRVVAGRPGAEFDGAWSPDGRSIVYRDSRRGINEDDEIYVVGADGSGPTNLTKDPANDWGPDWSPDGKWIAFNSDRDGYPMNGYLMDPTGGGVHQIEADAWVEYPSFSPDSTHIVFMGHGGTDYDIFTVELATGKTTRLTDSPGADAWPVWSPDGSTIAFTTERDDCLRAAPDQDCWRTDEPGEHHDIWLMDADGGNQRRVTPEISQFVAWSPDGRYLVVSGHALFVIRPDGTGRAEIRPPGSALPLGGIPDWVQ